MGIGDRATTAFFDGGHEWSEEFRDAARQFLRRVAHFDRAVRYEDALVYQEPPDWHVPARQNLANALMAANRPAEAETVLWEDLKRNPEHGWTLTLLSKALTLQGKSQEAAAIDARYAKSWKGAEAASITALRK